MSMLDMSVFGEAAEYLRKSYTEQLKLQTIPFDGKKRVWIPDEKEAYIEVEIKESTGGKVTVETKNKENDLIIVATQCLEGESPGNALSCVLSNEEACMFAIWQSKKL